MLKRIADLGFQRINLGYNNVFRPSRLSLGLVVPIENYAKSPVPAMTRHLARIQLAEALGFSAIWLRDVPFNVPSLGMPVRCTTRSCIWACWPVRPSGSH